MAAVSYLRKNHPNSEIHWVTKQEFAPLLDLHPEIDKVWVLDKRSSFSNLYRLANMLRKERFTIIYDAHKNLRSLLISYVLNPFSILSILFPKRLKWYSRSKSRLKRFFLFKLRINFFDKPFKGALSYLKPLRKNEEEKLFLNKNTWKFSSKVKEKVDSLLYKDEPFVCLAPSAAWEMKRWPIEYWKKLIEINPNKKFVILGGPKDDFCKKFEELYPDRVKNLAGKFSLVESCFAVFKGELLVSADTGLLHVADHLGKKAIALLGPTAFGDPSGEWVKSIKSDLPCQPCSKDGRGKCSQDVYQNCMIKITPELVSSFM
tara:strand:+ start:96 stop:1049 length:954 start_codon:yes stop_codon:yes gene_type:complete